MSVDPFTKKKEDNHKANCIYYRKQMSCPTKSGTSNMKKHFNLAYDDGVNFRMYKASETIFKEFSNEMMELKELPLPWVENLAWKHFYGKEKLYKLHSRKRTTQDIVDNYRKSKSSYKIKLNGNHISVHRCLVAVTEAHYWIQDVYDHKTTTISKFLIKCLEEWGNKSVFCITVNNDIANNSTMRQFKEGFKEIVDDDMVLKDPNRAKTSDYQTYAYRGSIKYTADENNTLDIAKENF
ncbi:hypothetical protein N665_4079s0001 [Sinapis alba]|nr:hypothetical protein N665_4079s0001 [Sinapis alba]